jgi:hypothetical protein
MLKILWVGYPTCPSLANLQAAKVAKRKHSNFASWRETPYYFPYKQSLRRVR